MRILTLCTIHLILHLSAALIGRNTVLRRIHRQLQIVRTHPVTLGIRIREGASLKQLVI
ncbi:hypothetical protein D3C76_1477830 [compost metagenome]